MLRNRILVAALLTLIPVTALLATPSGAPAAREAPERKIVPLVVISGSDGQIREREYHCIRDKTAWAMLWRRNRGISKRDYQHPAYDRWVVGVPQVDFGECMVIAVFKGVGSRAGVRGEWTTEAEDAFRFPFLANWQRDPMLPQPPPEHPTGKSMPPPPDLRVDPPEDPAPYDFFVFPRTDRPVVIEEIVQDGKPAEGRHVERARFE